MLVDIHSHPLLGLDDEAKSADASLAMLQQDWTDGIGTAVCNAPFAAER